MDEAWLEARRNETPDQKRTRLLANAANYRLMAELSDDETDREAYEADAEQAEADANNTPRS